MNILIPMAGLGSRFKTVGYHAPKPLIKVFNETMIEAAIKSLCLEGNFIFAIREFEDSEKTKELEGILRKIDPFCKILKVEKLTDGPAETCLLAKDFINNEEPLVIANCDQIMTWNEKEFSSFISGDMDGCVVTYTTEDPKHSFIELDDKGYGVQLREKVPISNIGLTGIHYWRRGKDFVESAESNIQENLRENGEFYVAPTYNYLIKKGMKISAYHIPEDHFNPVGTPKDLDRYLEKYQ